MMVSKKMKIAGLWSLLCLMQPVYARALLNYPNAQIKLAVDENRTDYPIITSRMKRVNGVVVSDGSYRLDGHLLRKLYLLSHGHSAGSGFEFYVNQLQKIGVSTLFECQNFACGASNFWANEVFGISQLYGQDKTQSFYIGKVHGRYYSVYSVRRGNGRVYTLVDVFTPAAMNPLGGSIDLSSVGNSSELDSWVARLKKEPGLTALLVIQSSAPATLQKLDALQQQMAGIQQSLLNYFRGQGIDASRLRFNQSLVFNAAQPQEKPHIWLKIVPVSQ